MTGTVVLLSAGLHPVSGRPAPVPVELQAIRLAAALAIDAVGLHAGPETGALRECLGHGLSRILCVDGDPADPLPALLPLLRALPTTMQVLAGRRGRGGEDGGMLPYRLAAALGWPIVADVVAAARSADGRLHATQWRPRAARRMLVLEGPAILTVHPAAPPPRPFAFAAMRRGGVERMSATPGTPSATPHEPADERARRRRPPVREAVSSADMSRRLVADATPEQAARLILEHLRAIGVLPGH